jgi:hypothetical protein
MMMAPSINALVFTGIGMLYLIILLATNYKTLFRLDVYKKISLVSLVIISIGIHGLLHLGAESIYGLNPYMWFMR